MALHRDLTGADLHEPKGADTASAGSVYIFDGSGSGAANKIGPNSLNLGALESPNTFYLSTILDDVSTNSFVMLPVLADCTIDSVVGVLENAITTSDVTITMTRNGIDSLGSAVVIPFNTSTKGTFFQFTAANNRDLTAGNYIQVTSDGASDTACRLFLVAKFTRTFV